MNRLLSEVEFKAFAQAGGFSLSASIYVEVPVKQCGADGPLHLPHRSRLRFGDWAYCPGNPMSQPAKTTEAET